MTDASRVLLPPVLALPLWFSSKVFLKRSEAGRPETWYWKDVGRAACSLSVSFSLVVHAPQRFAEELRFSLY